MRKKDRIVGHRHERKRDKEREKEKGRESSKARAGKTIRTRCTVVINVTAEGFARKCCSVKICNLARKDGWEREGGRGGLLSK